MLPKFLLHFTTPKINVKIGYYLLVIRLDVRTHLTIHCQILLDVYLVNLGIKVNIESSEAIWHSSDIYLTPFWSIKYSAQLLFTFHNSQTHNFQKRTREFVNLNMVVRLAGTNFFYPYYSTILTPYTIYKCLFWTPFCVVQFPVCVENLLLVAEWWPGGFWKS